MSIDDAVSLDTTSLDTTSLNAMSLDATVDARSASTDAVGRVPFAAVPAPAGPVRSTPAPRTRSTTRVPVVDWAWRNYRYVLCIGPVVGLDADLLRARLARVVVEHPDCRALFRVDHLDRSWGPVTPADADRHVADVVREDPRLGLPGGVEDVVTGLMNAPTGPVPVVLVVGAGYLAVSIDHLVGDGVALRELVPWLVLLGTTPLGEDGELPPPPMATSGVAPYRVALRHNLNRSTALPALRSAVRTYRARRRGPAEGAEPFVRVPGSRPVVEVAVVEREVADLYRDWRRRNAPGVSAAMLLTALAWAAARAEGVEGAGSPPSMVLDLRSYLPRRSVVAGNFVGNLTLPTGTVCHPSAVRDAAVDLMAGKSPLLIGGAEMGVNLLEGAVKEAAHALLRHGRSHRVPSREAPYAYRALVLNYTGRHRAYDTLPWCPGTPAVSVEAPGTDSPGVTCVNMSEVAGRFHLTALLHESATSRAAVRRALDLLARDPARVLALLDDLPTARD